MYIMFRSEDTGRYKVSVKLRSRRKKLFGPTIFRGKVYPRFWTYVFKSHSLAIVWLVLVEFRSASLQGIADEKKN